MQLDNFIIKIEGLANKVCADFFPVNDTRLDIALAPAGMWTVLDVALSASGSAAPSLSSLTT